MTKHYLYVIVRVIVESELPTKKKVIDQFESQKEEFIFPGTPDISILNVRWIATWPEDPASGKPWTL